ncbi:MAG TPA: hypothetical protein VEL76_33095 [Gemmataceae bacterium]|nr:hypothetical protein [Gemmataceae bacterium]
MLRSLLTLLGAAIVTFAIVGWFLGWYQVRTAPGPEGHRQVNIDFNGPKISKDLSTATNKIKNTLQPKGASSGPDSVSAPTLPPLPLPPGSPTPGSSTDVQPASGRVVVRPAPSTLPPLPLPVGIGNTRDDLH